MQAAFGMPSNYEMIISHSPPVYSHGYLTDYNHHRFCEPPPANFNCRPQMFSQIQNRLAAYTTTPHASSQQQPSSNGINNNNSNSTTHNGISRANSAPQLTTKKQFSSPKRPCLVVKSDTESEDQTDSSHQCTKLR